MIQEVTTGGDTFSQSYAAWTKLFSASSALVYIYNWTSSTIFIDSNLQDLFISVM
jgi:hypothetical protein